MVDVVHDRMTGNPPWSAALVDDVGAALAGVVFPASQDHLIAHLLRHHSPGRLVSAVALLDRTERYTGVEHVRSEIAARVAA